MDPRLEKFIFAISHNNLDAVRAFLKSNDVNIRLDCVSPHLMHCDKILRPYEHDRTGKYYENNHWFNITPLMYAAAFDSFDSLKLLLDSGADATAEDSISTVEGCPPVKAWIYKAQFSPYHDNPFYIEVLAPPINFSGEPSCAIEILSRCSEGFVVVDDSERPAG